MDALVRVAWLLRTSRLAGSDDSTAAFAEALARCGCSVNLTALSRFETGTAAVPERVIVGYERVLHLPAGRLLGVSLGLHRMFGRALVPNRTRPRRETWSDLLGVLESRIDDHTITGMDWLTLSQAICRPTGMLLPPSVLRSWTALLVSQAMRSVGTAYTTRMQALSLLISDRQTRLATFEEVERATSRPGAQAVIDVLATLGDTTDPLILRWLIQRLEQDSGPHQVGVAKALLTPVIQGTFPASLVPSLTQAILSAARAGGDRGLPAFWLAQRLSRPLTQQVVVALGRYPNPVHAGYRIQSPASLDAYIAAAFRASGLVDPMLERLLREALSPDFIERRHHALLLLDSSPYGQVLADTALDLLNDRSTSTAAADAAATALTYLARPAHRDRLVATLDSVPIGLKGTVLVALAHSGGVPATVDLLHHTADPEHAIDAVYAAGMSNHPDLQTMVTSSALADTPVRSAATWWCRTGPAIADRSMTVADQAAQGRQSA